MESTATAPTLWHRMRTQRPYQLAAAAALVCLAAAVLWFPFLAKPSSYPFALRLIHLGFPSLLALGAFILGAVAFRLSERAAVVYGAAVYVLVGLLLATANVAYVGAAMRGGLSLLAILIWPTLVLMQLGRWLGWVPLPE